MRSPVFAAAHTRLPDVPGLAVGVRHAVLAAPGIAAEWLEPQDVIERLRGGLVPIVCHMRASARRLGTPAFVALDVLELFAFVRPARFCVPTPRGLAAALLLPVPDTLEAEALAVISVGRALLAELTASPGEAAAGIAATMAAGGWPWATAVLTALGHADPTVVSPAPEALRVWQKLKEWEDRPAAPPSEPWPVEPVEARARLTRLLGAQAEPRPQQSAYASAAATAFLPRDRVGEPRVVLAEAGTGVGKTLGYIAPATVWAEKNRAPVWISTFTRNLQRQLDRELDRAFPSPSSKREKVVVRKGRENLFCLLNYEDALEQIRLQYGEAVALGLVARWALATHDGDMIGGDFPAWLADLLGVSLTTELTDTRGECIYGACRHFRRCFIERSIRRARNAEIVIANHALVMVQAMRGGDEMPPTLRYVFDEAHHIFDAADAAFSLRLSGIEAAEMRRWLAGAEDRRASRRRGLRNRLGDLLDDHSEAQAALTEIARSARVLPGSGWQTRLAENTPAGAVEAFLALVRQQVLARSRDGDPAYTLETDIRPAVPGLLTAAELAHDRLAELTRPLASVITALHQRLDAEAATLDSPTRQRIESLARAIQRRAFEPLVGWRAMLQSLRSDPQDVFVDFFAVERSDRREVDVGYFRHWLDPMRPFAEAVLVRAHGALMTSATLRDTTADGSDGWDLAELITGTRHLPVAAERFSLPSPFDYVGRTRVLVVTDVDRSDSRQVAAAYRELFLAAGGGALGLFTAISRLRTVHAAIAPALEAAGLRLLAQHVDRLDTGTMIDIFRDEADSCLLGTDAVRDGIDVPGPALRLIVFDRVPWPRPTLLHRARREAFGGRRYEEMLLRLRLKQAFGRLMRKADDRGVFVMLDRQLPSRLTAAFPAGVEILRTGLAGAISVVESFLHSG